MKWKVNEKKLSRILLHLRTLIIRSGFTWVGSRSRACRFRASRCTLDHALETGNLVSVQIEGGGVTGQRARSTVTTPRPARSRLEKRAVRVWSRQWMEYVRPMFRRQTITQIILLAKVTNTHTHNYSLLMLLAGRENLYMTVGCVAEKSVICSFISRFSHVLLR